MYNLPVHKNHGTTRWHYPGLKLIIYQPTYLIYQNQFKSKLMTHVPLKWVQLTKVYMIRFWFVGTICQHSADDRNSTSRWFETC